jgi:hypothetical protein
MGRFSIDHRHLNVAACRRRGLRPEGCSCVFPRDRRPFPDIPSLDRAADYIRIGLGKLLCYLGGMSLEEQDRSVDRVRERTAQQELTSLACFPGLLKVYVAKPSALGYIIFTNLRRTKDNAFEPRSFSALSTSIVPTTRSPASSRTGMMISDRVVASAVR